MLGTLSGVLWFLELEYAYEMNLDLGWLQGLNLAIPIGFLLFILWFNLYLSTNITKKAALNILALLVACAHFYWLFFAANKAYSRSPIAMFESFSQPAWVREAYEFSILLIPPVFALIVISFLKLFKMKRSYWRILLFTLSIAGIYPLGQFLFGLSNHRGISSDIPWILIPFVFLALGTLVVKNENRSAYP